MTRQQVVRGMNLALTVFLLIIGWKLVNHLQRLALVRRQVSELEAKLGSAVLDSATLARENQIWIKLIDSGPNRYDWRLVAPNIKHWTIAQGLALDDGTYFFTDQRDTSNSLKTDRDYIIQLSNVKHGAMSSSYWAMPGSAFDETTFSGRRDWLPTDFPPEAVAIEIFADRTAQSLRSNTPIPLLKWQVLESYIQAQLAAQQFDELEAKALRPARVFWIGTPEAIKSLSVTLSYPILNEVRRMHESKR